MPSQALRLVTPNLQDTYKVRIQNLRRTGAFKSAFKVGAELTSYFMPLWH